MSRPQAFGIDGNGDEEKTQQRGGSGGNGGVIPTRPASRCPRAGQRKVAAEFLRAAKFEGKMRPRERNAGSIGPARCRFMARGPGNAGCGASIHSRASHGPQPKSRITLLALNRLTKTAMITMAKMAMATCVES
jgi:hypothetical protein